MSVPTFTSVTPARGDAGGGQEVEIAGTGFRTTPVVFTVRAQESVPSATVTFDGEAAEQVKVVSDTLIRANVPTAVFNPNPTISPKLKDPTVSRVEFPPVDIVITNVNIDGVPIAGETVTAAVAYTYEQPLLRHPGGDSPLLQVFRELLRLFKRTIVMRVAKETHTDFGEEGETITALSEHPSIGLRLAWPRDPEYSHFDNEAIVLAVGGGVFERFDISRTVMLLATLTISARHDNTLFHMITEFIDTLMSTPFLIVPPDPDYPIAIPSNRYPLEHVNWPEQIGAISRTNVHAYSASCRVRGIPILRGDPADNKIRQISNIELVTSDIAGTSPVVSTV